MGWVLSVLTLLLLSAAALAIITSVLLLRERPRSGSTALAFTTGAIGVWSLAQAAVVSSTTLAVVVGGELTTMGASVLLTAGWVVFCLQYTGRADLLEWRWIGLAMVYPAVAIVLAVAAVPLDMGHLMVSDYTVSSSPSGAELSYDLGVGSYLLAGYLWGLTAGGNWLLYKKFLASRNVYRRRSFLFLTIGVVVLLSTISSALTLDPLPHYTLTPLVFLALAPVVLAILLSYRTISFLPIDRVLDELPGSSKSRAPIARPTIIEEMSIGVVVLDHKNRIVDLNPAAREILEGQDQRSVGNRLTDVVNPEIFEDGAPEFFSPDVRDAEYTGVWVELEHGERRCFDITLTSSGLTEEGDEPSGRIGFIADVTDRERRKQALEVRARELKRQNDQLEDFAHVVSHDLRNPVNVASGYLDLAEEEGDEEHFEQVRQAHERMQALIDDVLQMVRHGKSVETTESVDLATAAEHAWSNVDTADATLEVEDSRSIQADQGRVGQLLENLYRNAVEHAGSAVTVTVGPLEDGFYVEDSGPGIPPAKRDDVFEKGVTGSESGTGLGLAIVETIVEAHGWSVDVTEGTSGGARFEIRGCRTVETPDGKQDRFPITSGTD